MPVWRFAHLARVDSTNRYAADAARRGEQEGLVVVADEQSAGRGRFGRRWVAPPGGALLCSLLLRPALAPDERHLVTSAVALAARDAIGTLIGVEVALKWPNDLVVGDAKLAGLLAEVVPAAAGRDERAAVVVGIGINLELPAEFREVGENRELLASATSLAEVAKSPGRDALLGALLVAFAGRYDALSSADGRDATRREQRLACSTIGAVVLVSEVAGSWQGTAEAIDDSGRLVVVRDGTRVVLEAADVVHVRRATGER